MRRSTQFRETNQSILRGATIKTVSKIVVLARQAFDSAEVVARAQQVLDEAEAAREWLRTPHSMLGGESPLTHMDTVTGMNEVKTMLDHIEYGLPA
jgi:putative toxin-antitoxin system antitoxin component (TIGR02293 family)